MHDKKQCVLKTTPDDVLQEEGSTVPCEGGLMVAHLTAKIKKKEYKLKQPSERRN
mgnify:CR=1 FL=1